MTDKTLEFIQKAEKVHGDKYDYSKVKYKNCDTNITIICKIHNDFLQTPYTHLHSNGCKKCGYENLKLKKMGNTEEFIKKAILKHGDKYNYSKVVYENVKKHVIIICEKHGDFEQTPDKHLQGGCKKCGIESMILKQSGNTEEFIQKAKLKHGDKYNYSKINYINNKSEIIIICNEHGEFKQIASSHLVGSGCIKCGIESSKLKQTGNTDEFIQKAKLKHGDKYDYSKIKYISCYDNVIIICKIHGNFLQQPASHIAGNGCKKCGIENSKLKQT